MKDMVDTIRRRLGEEYGFQTAEAIGIAAVGLLVLLAILTAMESLGVDVIEWMRSQLGVPGS